MPRCDATLIQSDIHSPCAACPVLPCFTLPWLRPALPYLTLPRPRPALPCHACALPLPCPVLLSGTEGCSKRAASQKSSLLLKDATCCCLPCNMCDRAADADALLSYESLAKVEVFWGNADRARGLFQEGHLKHKGTSRFYRAWAQLEKNADQLQVGASSFDQPAGCVLCAGCWESGSGSAACICPTQCTVCLRKLHCVTSTSHV